MLVKTPPLGFSAALSGNGRTAVKVWLAALYPSANGNVIATSSLAVGLQHSGWFENQRIQGIRIGHARDSFEYISREIEAEV